MDQSDILSKWHRSFKQFG